ncbi:MAG: hypothetical protein AAF738_09560, partial [Bacteroidota bacterium]
MKKNYDIHRNPKIPSEAQIAKHQDFDALLEQLNASSSAQVQKARVVPHTTRWWFWRVGVAALCLLGAFGLVRLLLRGDSVMELERQYAQQQVRYFQEQPYYIQPPVAVPASYTQYEIQAETGGTYQYAEATKIQVPDNAFQDQNGALIKGKVQLFYREMHDYIDFFLSGIPMTYDSTGVRYNLESAGMVEIYAEQDGQR